MLSCFCPYRRPHVSPSLHISLYLINAFHIPAIPDVTEESFPPQFLPSSSNPLSSPPTFHPLYKSSVRMPAIPSCVPVSRRPWLISISPPQPLSHHHSSAISGTHRRLGSSIHMRRVLILLNSRWRHCRAIRRSCSMLALHQEFWSVSLQDFAACWVKNSSDKISV